MYIQAAVLAYVYERVRCVGSSVRVRVFGGRSIGYVPSNQTADHAGMEIPLNDTGIEMDLHRVYANFRATLSKW